MCGSKKEIKNKLVPAHGYRKNTVVQLWSGCMLGMLDLPHHVDGEKTSGLSGTSMV
jgi:hypothetical protein